MREKKSTAPCNLSGSSLYIDYSKSSGFIGGVDFYWMSFLEMGTMLWQMELDSMLGMRIPF